MSGWRATIETMFEAQLPDEAPRCGLDCAGLVDAMTDAMRIESAAAELTQHQRRTAFGQNRGGSTSAMSTAAPPASTGPGYIAAQTHPAPRTGGSVPAIPPPAPAAPPGLD